MGQCQAFAIIPRFHHIPARGSSSRHPTVGGRELHEFFLMALQNVGRRQKQTRHGRHLLLKGALIKINNWTRTSNTRLAEAKLETYEGEQSHNIEGKYIKRIVTTLRPLSRHHRTLNMISPVSPFSSYSTSASLKRVSLPFLDVSSSHVYTNQANRHVAGR